MANEAVVGALRATLGIDNADWERGLDRSSKQLDTFEKQVNAVGQRIGVNLGGALKVASGVFAAIGAAELVQQVANYTDRILKQTAAFKDLAEQVNLTTDAYQALRLASIGAGVTQEQMQASFLKLNQVIGQAIQGNGTAIDLFKSLGVHLLDAAGNAKPFQTNLENVAVALSGMASSSQKSRLELEFFGRSGKDIDNVLDQIAGGVQRLQDKFANRIVSQQVIDDLAALEKQSAQNTAKFEAFYAAIAAPIYLGTINAIADYAERIAKAFSVGPDKGWIEVLKLVTSLGGSPTMGKAVSSILGNSKAAPEGSLADLQEQLKRNQEQQAQLRGKIAGGNVIDIVKQRLQRDLEQLEADQKAIEQKIQNARQAADQSDEDAARVNSGAFETSPVFRSQTGDRDPNKKSTKTGTKHDAIGAKITQLKGQTLAAQAALKAMVDGAGIPLDILERNVELQKKIDDAIAGLGKYDKNDPRIAELKQRVTEEFNAEQALKDRMKAEQTAADAEKTFGDGMAEYTKRVRELNDALATKRLGPDAFNAAMKQANDQLEEQELKARGAKGGIDAWAAGFESAANKVANSDTAFAEGAKAFDLVTESVNEAVDAFVFADGDIGQTLTNIAKKIEQYAFNLLVMKPIFDAIKEMISPVSGSGGGGGLFGWISSLFGGGGGGASYASIGDLIPTLGLAGGGRSPVGVPYLVGENGPEIRVDDSPGTIYSHADSMQMMRSLASRSSSSTPTLVSPQEFGAGNGGGSTLVQHINVLPDVNQSIRKQIYDNLPVFAEAGSARAEARRKQGGTYRASFKR